MKFRTVKKWKADCLSRFPEEQETGDSTEAQNYVWAIDMSSPIMIKWKQEAVKDVALNQVQQWVKDGWPKTLPSKFSKDPYLSYFKKRMHISFQDDCVVLDNRIIVPEGLRLPILRDLHQQHLGRDRMLSTLTTQYWWPHITVQLESFLASCTVCQSNARLPRQQVHSSWNKSNCPMERIHLDFFHFAGQQFLLLIDSCSKWIHVELMARTMAQDLIRVLKSVFLNVGYPQVIVTDNGPPFSAFIFLDWCRSLNIRLVHSPQYHPESNGVAERGSPRSETFFK